MSRGLHASLLSYEFSRSNHASPPSNSSSQSPKSIRSRSPQLSLQRPRLKPNLRQSYEERKTERIKVQYLGESIARDKNFASGKSHTGLWEEPLFEQAEAQGSNAALALNPTLVQELKHSSKLSPSPSLVDDSITIKSSLSNATDGHSSRAPWTRTRSGGVWYHVVRGTSSHDNSPARSARSARSTTGTPNGSELGRPSVVPLKPPPRPEPLQTAPTHHITIETPFGDVRDESPSATDTCTSLHDHERKVSVGSRHLFSAPLLAIRRVMNEKQGKAAATLVTQPRKSLSLVNSRRDGTTARHDQVDATLDRAASILEDVKVPKIKGRLRAWTGLSTSTSSSLDNHELKHEQSRPWTATFNIFKRGSMDHVASATSSVLDLEMGATPQNSPTELATYRIKRSASADSEVYPKIDISIRGQTSYLPSEARRIHTPPLPKYDRGGPRGGFFFNYNAPKFDVDSNCDKKPRQIISSQSLSPSLSPLTGSKSALEYELTRYVSAKANVSTKVPLVRRSRSPTSNTPPRMLTNDWYDLKLADLDASIPDTDTSSSARPMEQDLRSKHACQARPTEIRRQKYEAQLDYNIPEHLPSSPLCPRHPKYWRVVKGKGDQFRGCWMHGFGVYETLPGRAAQ